MSAYFLAKRYVFGARQHRMGGTISLLSIFGLALGCGILIAVLSVMNGFDRELRDKILTMVPHIRLLPDFGLESWQQDSAFIAEDKDILSATPYAELTGLIRYRGEASPMLLWGTDPAQEIQKGQLKQQLGAELFSQLESAPGVFLGQELADQLGVSVGETITLITPEGTRASFAGLEVLGFFATGTELDRRMAITSLQTMQDVALYQSATKGIAVYTNRVFDAYTHGYQILQALPRGYRASTWMASHGNLFEAIQMSRYMVALIVFLLLGIAAFNVVASLMITSADRQSDIAILKTLGAQSGFLIKLFSMQGLYIGLIGAFSGALLGILLSYGLTDIVRFLEVVLNRQFLQSNIYPLSYLPSQLSWIQVLLVSLVAVTLSTLGSLYPAWRVLSVQPAETLRYE